jgi:hypothetical protein
MSATARSRREVIEVGPRELEEALPGWRFIHTHFGFGYRLAPEHERSADDRFTTG